MDIKSNPRRNTSMLSDDGWLMSPDLSHNNEHVDVQSTCCQKCSSQFTLIVRKHFCRSCRSNVCGKCSSVEIVTKKFLEEKLGYRKKPNIRQRVCCDCKSNATGKQTSMIQKNSEKDDNQENIYDENSQSNMLSRAQSTEKTANKTPVVNSNHIDELKSQFDDEQPEDQEEDEEDDEKENLKLPDSATNNSKMNDTITTPPSEGMKVPISESIESEPISAISGSLTPPQRIVPSKRVDEILLEPNKPTRAETIRPSIGSLIRGATNHPPRIAVTGAPGAGKSTQCEVLRQELGVIHLSVGDILRTAVKEASEQDLQGQSVIENFKLSDEFVTRVVVDRLQKSDCMSRGWLLDDFPRNKLQAAALSFAGMSPDCFILLDVPEDILNERVTGRRIDPATGKIYHQKYNPAKSKTVMARLTQRGDDSALSFAKRYCDYMAHIESVKAWYSDRLLCIDASAAPFSVSHQIMTALDSEYYSNTITPTVGDDHIPSPISPALFPPLHDFYPTLIKSNKSVVDALEGPEKVIQVSPSSLSTVPMGHGVSSVDVKTPSSMNFSVSSNATTEYSNKLSSSFISTPGSDLERTNLNADGGFNFSPFSPFTHTPSTVSVTNNDIRTPLQKINKLSSKISLSLSLPKSITKIINSEKISSYLKIPILSKEAKSLLFIALKTIIFALLMQITSYYLINLTQNRSHHTNKGPGTGNGPSHFNYHLISVPVSKKIRGKRPSETLYTSIRRRFSLSSSSSSQYSDALVTSSSSSSQQSRSLAGPSEDSEDMILETTHTFLISISASKSNIHARRIRKQSRHKVVRHLQSLIGGVETAFAHITNGLHILNSHIESHQFV